MLVIMNTFTIKKHTINCNLCDNINSFFYRMRKKNNTRDKLTQIKFEKI